MINFPLAHIESKFILDGQTYEVEAFETQFSQPVDYKQQPQHEVIGGLIKITLTHAANSNLYLWAKTATMLKNGAILFQTDLGITILRVEFANGYCVGLTRHIDASAGTKTMLVIAAENIKMNGTEHDNFWPNK